MDKRDLYFRYNETDGFPPQAEEKSAVSEPVKAKKRSGKKAFGIAIACVLAAAIISCGSIGMYAALSANSAAGSTNVTWNAAPTAAEVSSSDSSSSVVTAANDSGKTELTTEEIYEKYVNSVVEITASYSYMGQEAAAGGTGVIMSADGYILTNAHIVANTVQLGGKVTVDLYDKTEYEAKIIGSDSTSDIAVIKIEASGLTPAVFGDSDGVKVGQRAVAIGNPLSEELTFTTTQGIISAINRNIEISGKQMTLLQTDAAINAGNSGGPLFNKYGEVIGITSAKLMSSVYTGTTAEGIGFAIPSNSAMTIAKSLMENGYVAGRPLVGISGTDVTDEMASQYNVPRGVYVQFVTQGTPAEQSGIKAGDIITKFNNVEVSSRDELVTERDKLKAGDTVPVTVWRDGQTIDLTLTLGQNTEG